MAADLKDIVNLETNQPVFKEILKTADHYTGERIDDLPDIVVRYNRDVPIRRVHSTKIGEMECQSQAARSGDHRPDSVFFARGPNLQPKQLDQPVSTMDLAATMSNWLDLALPNIDGEPIPDLIKGRVRTS